MENLTTRQQFTLNKILNEGSVEVQDLYKQLDVGQRTISREVNSINKFLKKYSLSIYCDNDMTLKISGKKEKFQELRTELSSVPLQWVLNREQRQIIIACQLLLNAEAVKASYYSNKFNVVLGSISLDLDELAKWVISKNLCLIRSRNAGVRIEGSEWNKRNAIVDLVFKYKSYEELLAFLYGEKFDEMTELLFNMIFGEKITLLGKEILRDADLSEFNLNDVKYFTSFIQILIAMKKLENNEQLKLPDKIKNNIVALEEYKEIEALNSVLKENGTKLAEDELIYIWLNLTNYKFLFKNEKNVITSDYKIIAKEVAREVSKKIGVNLEEDLQLIEDLAKHFRQTFNMLNLGLKVINPLIDEIKEHYTEMFNDINNVCKLVFSRYNLKLPEEEIGYVTLHIDVSVQRKRAMLKKLNVLVVCHSGIGSARILSNKIKFIFPDIGDVAIEALHDIDRCMKNNNYDLILSTVPINLEKYEEKIIVVSPFITKDDIEKINEFILNLKVQSTSRLMEKMVDEVTKEDYDTANDIIKNFQIKNTKADKVEQLVDFAVNNIKDIGLTKDELSLKKAILKREEDGNVVIQGTNVALLHTRIEGIKIPYIGVYRIEEPIVTSGIGFSKENVNTFIVMVARRQESNYILQFLGKVSVALNENEQFIRDLKTGSIVEIRNHLINIGNEEVE